MLKSYGIKWEKNSEVLKKASVFMLTSLVLGGCLFFMDKFVLFIMSFLS